MKKKRNKKYNMRKTDENMSRLLTKDKGVVYFTGGNYQAFKLINGKPLMIPMSAALRRAFGIHRYNWHVSMSVLGLDAFGKRYIKTEHVAYDNMYTHAELTPVNNEKHLAMIHSMNPKQLVNAAWVGFTRETDISDEVLLQLYEDIGAFDWQLHVGSEDDEVYQSLKTTEELKQLLKGDNNDTRNKEHR